jgi:toxin ParE1/3/4
MVRYRLARRAQVDISRILATSAENWGVEARRRYAGLLTHAIRRVADQAEGGATRQRTELAPGMRSFHVRQVQQADPGARVRRPVHVLYYRAIQPGWSKSSASCTSGWSQAGIWALLPKTRSRTAGLGRPAVVHKVLPYARPQERSRPGLRSGARRRRSNRPGNSQAKGLRGEGRSGKRRASPKGLTSGLDRTPKE